MVPKVVFVLKEKTGVLVFLHVVNAGKLFTCADGRTVIVKLTGVPWQLVMPELLIGVTVIVLVIGVEVVF